MRLHGQAREHFWNAGSMFQSTEGRDLENGYRICKICLMEQKNNMRVKHIHVCTYIMKFQDTKNIEKTQKHSLEEISDPPQKKKNHHNLKHLTILS